MKSSGVECKKIEQNMNEMISGIRREIELVEELRIKTIADIVTEDSDDSDE